MNLTDEQRVILEPLIPEKPAREDGKIESLLEEGTHIALELPVATD